MLNNATSTTPVGEIPHALAAAQNSAPSMQNYQDHDGHASSDEEDDDDGGVAIPSNTTSATHYPPVLQDTDDNDIEMISTEQASHPSIADTHSMNQTPQGEPSTGTADSPAYLITPPIVPIAMSQLSQQLAQIQEAQGNDLDIEMLGHIGSVHNNSIPPTLPYPPPLSPPPAESGGDDIESMYESSDNGSISIVAQTASVAITQMYPPTMAEMHNATAPDTPQPFTAQTTFHWSLEDQVAFISNADFEFFDQVDVDQNSYTLSMYDFLWAWGNRASRGPLSNKKRIKGPELGSLERQRAVKSMEIRRCDLQGDQCDIQGMNWLDMEVTRREAREARTSSYRNYESIPAHSPFYDGHRKEKALPALPNTENFLRFRRMNMRHKPHLSHFQLRNLIACTSRSNVFYAGNHKVHHTNPLRGTSYSTVMDLTDPDVQPNTFFSSHSGVLISTLAAKYDILLAGGFNGEYGLINLNSPLSSGHVEGLIPVTPGNSITNHISLSLSRSSGLPQAAFASNDNGIRVLDCTTNTFTASYTYPFPVNCTAISPDGRLRVVVGDTRNVHICDTETGKTLQNLPGHSDFGFACAWADNGWHVATGNQDMTVKIWDARMWKNRWGVANPLKTIRSELAGVRSLQFSPLGSGKRILLACEAADVIDVIDAESYDSKQVLDFFGEIGGACFTPDGQDIFVANCDNVKGGIIEFERTGEGARLGYRMDQRDINEINRDLSRKNNRAWLNGEGESDDNANHMFSPETMAILAKIGGSVGYTSAGSESIKFAWKDPYQPAYYSATKRVEATLKKMQQAKREIQDKDTTAQPTKPSKILPSSSPFPPLTVRERVHAFSSHAHESKAEQDESQQLQRRRDRMGWNSDAEDILDSEDDGYISIEERMRRQIRGYDWRQTDTQILTDSRSTCRTLTWQRRKCLFGEGGSVPLGGSDMGMDVGL